MSSRTVSFLAGAALFAASFALPGSTLLGSAFLFNLAAGSLQLVGLGLASRALTSGISAENQGIKINSRDTLTGLPVVYGDSMVGLRVADIRVDPNSTDRKDLYIVGALCHGSQNGTGIEAINQIWFDDRLAFESDGTLQQAFKKPHGTFAGVTFTDMAAVTKYLGTSSQTNDPTLTAKFPTEWPVTSDGRLVAYIVLKLTYDQAIYPNGIPNVTVRVQGAKCFDPRSSTTAWTTNPILCLRDYLTSAAYGLGAAASEIDDTDVQTMANYCEEQITGIWGTINRFAAGGALDTARALEDNVRRLLTACRGELIYEAGKFRMHIPRAVTPSGFAFTEANIVGDWSFRKNEAASVPNVIRASFINLFKNFEADEIQWPEPSATNPFLTNDNGHLSELAIELPMVTHFYRAKQIAMVHLKERRQDLTVSFLATQAALEARTGDVVVVTHPTPGWTAKEFWVVAMAPLPGTGQVRVALREYVDTAYDYETIAEDDVAADTGLPDPYSLAQFSITNLVLTSDATTVRLRNDGSVIPRVLVTWDAVPNHPFVSYYELQHRPSPYTGSFVPLNPVDGADTPSVYLEGMTEGSHEFRVRAVNSLGVASIWVYDRVTVVGVPSPTTAPTDPVVTSGLVEPRIKLRWTPVPVATNPYIVNYEAEVRHDPATGGDGLWKPAGMVGADAAEVIYAGVRHNQQWQGRVRAIDVGGGQSAWVTSALHTVKLEGFPDPTFGTPVADVDAVDYPVTFDADTAYVDFWSREHVAASGADPLETPQYYAGRLNAGELSLRIPTTANYYRRTLAVAFGPRGQTRGTFALTETQAVNVAAGPSGPPTGLTIGTTTTTTIPISWTNGDATAQTRIYVDGAPVFDQTAGLTAYTIPGLEPSTSYEIQVAHLKNGKLSSLTGIQVGTTQAAVLGAPQDVSAFADPGPESDPGFPLPRVAVTFTPGTDGQDATHQLQRSPDDLTGWTDRGSPAAPGITLIYDSDAIEAGNTWYFRLIAKRTGWTDSPPSASDPGTYSTGDYEPQ